VIALVAMLIYIIFLFYCNKLIIPVTIRDQACDADNEATPRPVESEVRTPDNPLSIPVTLAWFHCLPTGTATQLSGDIFQLQRTH